MDASEGAYGAVVYARYNYPDGSISTNIVSAKTRVAPSIAINIPRLELMGTVIDVRLTTRISKVLEILISRAIFWSDSINVIWWIRGCSRQFKTFVANRVGVIQSSINPEQWRYVPTRNNPADLLSRGMRAGELRDCDSWWRGPEFVMISEATWPINKVIDKPTENDELKRSTGYKLKSKAEPNGTNGYTHAVEEAHPMFVTAVDSDATFATDPCQYSSWLRLRRVLTWVNRFIGNCH